MTGRALHALRFDPATLAGLARRAPEPLLGALDLPPVRAVVVSAVFRQMPRQLRRGADAPDAVVCWEVQGARWYLVLRDGTALTTRRHDDERPRVTLTLSARELVRLATGAAPPMAMFQEGRIRISGDLWFAAQLSSMFEIPAT